MFTELTHAADIPVSSVLLFCILQAEKEAFEEAEKERKAREDKVKIFNYELLLAIFSCP